METMTEIGIAVRNAGSWRIAWTLEVIWGVEIAS